MCNYRSAFVISQMDPVHEGITTTYAGFNARDIEVALSLLHPDVDWPNGMDGGRMVGREAVREYWIRQWSLIDPHLEPIAFCEEPGSKVAVDVHLVVRDLDGNVLVDQMIQHVYTIRDHQVMRMDIREPT